MVNKKIPLPTTDIGAFLSNMASHQNSQVREKIKIGDIIGKSAGFFYRMDEKSFNIVKEKFADEMRDRKIPYGHVANGLRSDSLAILQLFKAKGVAANNRTELPFSLIFENGVGECLEKSIFLQMAAQEIGVNSFLISASIMDRVSLMSDAHAFNVQEINKIWLVVDAQNPIRDSEGVIKAACVLPISAIDIEKGAFLLTAESEKFLGNASYSLWH